MSKIAPSYADLEKLMDACKEMKAVILDNEIPQGVVRRYCSFEVAEFIYSDNRLLDH